MRLALLLTLLVLLPAVPGAGQAPATARSPAAPPAAATGRVEVPPASDKAMRYYRSGNVLWLVRTAWGMAVPAVILFTGLSARMRRLATAIGRKWFFIVGAYVVLYLALDFAVNLPLDWYGGWYRQHDYGLSTQTLGKWFGDAFKGLAVGMVGGVAFLWLPYLLLRKSPRRWWLYSTLAFIPVSIFVVLVVPVWVDPLFNDFGPMKDKVLEARILALAERAGIEGGRVYEVNKSVDTSTVNAYVTGFGGSKRIVLWDTTLAKLTPDEVLFVMGHEMGHFVLGHVVIGLCLGTVLAGVVLYGIHRTAGGLIRRCHARFGFDELSDVASLPLLILLGQVFAFVLAPVTNGISRAMEHEADRFGLEITRDNHDAATAFVKLQQENLGNPRPGLLFKLWRASHPTLGDRIDFCNEYRPWEHGKPLRYGDRFRE